jgi:hypothetical protein
MLKHQLKEITSLFNLQMFATLAILRLFEKLCYMEEYKIKILNKITHQI